MQLIHWFTNNKKFESQDTVAVLEAILVSGNMYDKMCSQIFWGGFFVDNNDFLCRQDGVVDPKDSTLRDFSGRCIEEFVKWSIKQTSPKQQEKSPTNMKSLFKRIYSLALHPNGFKRLGAALAFNSIYRQFRCKSFFLFYSLQPQRLRDDYDLMDSNNNAELFSSREENSLVEQFIFEVLVIFVESLALAHTDERSMGNTRSTNQA